MVEVRSKFCIGQTAAFALARARDLLKMACRADKLDNTKSSSTTPSTTTARSLPVHLSPHLLHLTVR